MIIAIIQARMGSTRLPGKVLKTVGGSPLLEIQLDRVRQSRKLDQVVVATSTLDKDQPIVDLCARLGVDCFRGSESDVLLRFYQAASKFGAETIVRLTADCPLIDPEVIDQVIEHFQREKADYAANTVPPETSRFPDGSDVEVFSFAALEKANREATDKADREHVTFYFWKRGQGFRTTQLSRPEDWSSYRLTVDYPEDLVVVEHLLNRFPPGSKGGRLAGIIAELQNQPEIRKLNASHHFGEGWEKKA